MSCKIWDEDAYGAIWLLLENRSRPAGGMLDLLSEVVARLRGSWQPYIIRLCICYNGTMTQRLFHSFQCGGKSVKAGEDDIRLAAYAGREPGRQQGPDVGVRNPIFLAAFPPKQFVPRPEVLRIFMIIPRFTLAHLPLRSQLRSAH